MITFVTKHDSAYEPGTTLTPGFYNALVLEYEERVSAAGLPMVVLTLAIYEKPEHEAKHLHVPGKFFVTYQSKSQDPWWKFAKAAAACGNRFAAGQEVTLEPRMFTGKRLAVRTSLTPKDKGGFFMSVDDVLARDKAPHYGALSPEEYAKYQLDEYGVSVRLNYTRPLPAGGGGAAAPATPAAPAAAAVDLLADDDIPF